MAHHKAASKQRWLNSQKAEVGKLDGRSMELMHTNAEKRYYAIIKALPRPLPIDASILEIGCGAVCTAKLFNSSNTTYLDPLLDDFKRTFPGELPDGEFIAGKAEEIVKPDSSYDLILCLNTLSYTLNPELVMHETRRLLKQDGIFVISIITWPELLARLHYLKSSFFSLDEHQTRLYHYSYRGIVNTLRRHFDIVNKLPVDTSPPRFSQEWVFICQRKNSNRSESAILTDSGNQDV